jgi:RHS repeat-associated protein
MIPTPCSGSSQITSAVPAPQRIRTVAKHPRSEAEGGSWNSTIQYTAYGEIRLTEGVTPTKYRYIGQLAQAELGLDYYVARWYDPVTGHFTSADTIIPEPGKASAFDRYGYVQNNPLRLIDPSGYKPCDGPGLHGKCDQAEKKWRQPQQSPLPQSSSAGKDKNSLSAVDWYVQGWTNFGTAWYINTNTNSPMIDRYKSGNYMSTWVGAHIGLAVGLAGLSCAATGPVCGTTIAGALGIGAAISADGDPTNEIQAINTGTYTVYQYVQEGIVKYYGMTIDFGGRAGQHLASRGWKIDPIEGLFKNLSYYDARSVEQALIEQTGLENLNNLINSIAKSNPNYPLAIQNGNNILKMLRIMK